MDYKLVCLVCLFGFNVAFNIICHITMVSGCDRELNSHFYSAASLWYQIPDTLPDTTSSHIILTPSPTPKIGVPGGEQLVPLLTTLVCRGSGSNPVPPDHGFDTLPTVQSRGIFTSPPTPAERGLQEKGLKF